MRRTPLRRVSKQRAKEMKEYAMLRAEYLKLRPVCEAHHIVFLADCTWTASDVAIYNESATDIHHVEGRGKNYLRKETWLPVCRTCHRWIHDHPKTARELGLLR